MDYYNTTNTDNDKIMITVHSDSENPLYQQIYEQIKTKIMRGDYPEGFRLISTRQLSKELCVGRNTVESAYAQLCLEGYVKSMKRSGFIVNNVSDDNPHASNKMRGNGCLQASAQRLSRQSIPGYSSNNPRQYDYDFQYGSLDPSLFPYSQWRRLTSEILSSNEAQNINYYNNIQGELNLRIEIMKYLGESRGVLCNPEQIILCSGTRYALEIICKLFPKERRTAAFEEPGYDGSRIVFENNGYKINPIPLRKEGVDIEILANGSPGLVYITPSHQFPTGLVMPIQHRTNLLDWAVQTKSVIIEDDYDSEYRYHSRPIPSLQSIDRHKRVIYLGTFSKSLAPGLRMSYMILPEWMLAQYHKLFSRYPSTVSWLQQQVMSLYMARGYWQRHLRKVCLKNKKKYDILLQAIQDQFGNRVQIHNHNAGLHILLEFNNGEQQEYLEEKAGQYNVKVYPTLPFWHQKENCPKNEVLLGFSNFSETEIIEGIRLLNLAWF